MEPNYNRMIEILIVVGTRPEAIKMAKIYLDLKNHNGFKVKLCNTGQHKEMIDDVLDFFEIKADFNLKAFEKGQSLNKLSSKIISSLDIIFQTYTPSLVLVHGDTTTTFSATLAAFNASIKVGHVEAGLRTYNLKSPWPEEANRRLTSLLADFHYAPTKRAQDNLVKEGVENSRIIITGNSVIDSLLYTIELNKKKGENILTKLKIDRKTKYILVTSHRRENLGSGIIDICISLLRIATEFPEILIIFPVHLNPKISNVVYEKLSDIINIKIINPQKYSAFVELMSSAYLILTDSGGIQEEAPSLNIPVLVLRDTTERPEAIDTGAVKLIGTNTETIFTETSKILKNKATYEKMAQGINPFGDGKCSERIIKHLKNFNFS